MFRPILTLLIILTASMPLMLNGAVLNIDGAEATLTGIYIKNLKTGKVIANHNSTIAMTPASVMKSITTATALEMLGPDFRFTTRVALAGKADPSDRRRWQGDLVIFASGDPTVESDQFKYNLGLTDSIIDALHHRGIGEITGSVVVVDNMSDQGPVPQWEVEDIAWPYGAGLYGFNYAGNYVRALPNKGETRPASGLNIEVLPSPEGEGTDILRGAGSNDLTVWASAKNRRNPSWWVNVTVPDPAAVYTGLLLSRLHDAGISTGKEPEHADTGDTTTIYVHRSPESAEIMRDLMKRSDNLFAEGMLRAIAPQESRSDCIKAEKAYWKERGIDPRYALIRDGSGLARSNRLSPRFLGDILEAMARGKNAETYVSFFPVAGVDGTLSSFLRKTRLKGKLALKTGSVASVQCYAGYKLDWEGKPTHVVVVMVNGFFCPRATLRGAIEKYLLNTFK